MSPTAAQHAAHPFPYQGSKRRLAPRILRCVPGDTHTLIEPFAGSAAVAIAVGYAERAKRFVLGDIHAPLISLWREIVHHPQQLGDGYRRLWESQKGRDRVFYDQVRDRFNKEHHPSDFLYLLARCVKAAIRYNARGEFNNSPDKRRQGMQPDTMERNIREVARLFAGRTEIHCQSYTDTLRLAQKQDLVYMDPPYQGVCRARNHRYLSGVAFDEFVAELEALNGRSISYIVSYDGRTGSKTHGRKLPGSLELRHEEILAGRSTQATLLGRTEATYESIYLSPALLARLG